MNTLRCRNVFLFGVPRHDFQRLVWQRALHAFASSHGARIQTSRSSSVIRITGIALGWIGATIAFGAVLRKP
jgi:hypothetical protein